MPLRNLFGRRTGPVHDVQNENAPPHQQQDPSTPGFERVDTVGSKSSSAMSIKSGRSIDTGAYKLSVVNDSGVYLPPSPTEDPSEKGLWPRRYMPSRTSSDAHSTGGDIEPFSISRESFDSYRRSFDICAKSPIVTLEGPTRQSLDSARYPRPYPRHTLGERLAKAEPPTEEDNFEEVGLDAEGETRLQPRRKFFSIFDSQESNPHATPGPGMSRFLPGRKRAQSGAGAAELGVIERPAHGQQGSEMIDVPAAH